MRRAWRWTFALLLGLTATFASALDVPADAEVFVTDPDSRIVGLGRVVAGERFELVLVDGYAGRAVLVWLSPDGGVRTTEVVVADGVVWVDGVELTSVLPEGFSSVHVRIAAELGDAWPPDVRQGPPAEAPGRALGREPPAGAGPPGPPARPPGSPDDGPPDDGEPDDGEPDDDTPGRPEDTPGRRP